mmetsp:Transcript_15313/g.27813  ORF Transcript_15313/g.27813 Transcript_15313/m.27813 type:complete len:82 (-) Transcript_15313:456-701(-)
MDVFAFFDVPSNTIESYKPSFLGGFPPKVTGIRPNESLIVKMSLSGAQNSDAKHPATKSAAANEPATESESSAVSNSGHPK